jgi:hypothetical protein
MPVTVTYDFTQVPAQQGNDRTYLRSMFERLHWRRVGGSVFRYEGVLQPDGTRYEDWLNHIAPALMFMRSYVVRRGLQMSFFTIDAASVSFLDHTDPQALLGTSAQAQVQLAQPTNPQCPPDAIERFLTAATNALPEPPQQP